MEDLELMQKNLTELSEFKSKLQQGGSTEAVAKHRAKGKLTARERINKLMDQGTFKELDIWGTPMNTGFPIDDQEGSGDGVAVGYGQVYGRPIYVWAQDATVRGGTMACMHAQKIAMVMDKAIQTRIPIVGIIDSEGARIEDAIQYHRFYSPEALAYFQTMASGVIPQISLIMGPCIGEMAIVSQLSDFVFMVRNNSFMRLAEPPEGMTDEEVGDPNVHAEDTGCCDYLADNDEDCIDKCRMLLSFLPSNNQEKPPVVNTGDDPNRKEEDLLSIVPFNSRHAFDMRKVINLIVDNSEFFDIKSQWSINMIIGFARLDGKTVGFIANNPQFLGGSLTLDAADKMAGFVRFCDAFNIPVIWLADTPAFLPSVDEETRGLIRHGCKVVFSNAEATVPQITIAIRKLFGGGQLAMPGTTLGGDFDMAWPTVERGLMGGEGAVVIVYKSELDAIADDAARDEKRAQRIEEMRQKFMALEREWAQDFLDPRDTRSFLIRSLEVLSQKNQVTIDRKHENIRL